MAVLRSLLLLGLVLFPIDQTPHRAFLHHRPMGAVPRGGGVDLHVANVPPRRAAMGSVAGGRGDRQLVSDVSSPYFRV
jgi:hypothetical protein